MTDWKKVAEARQVGMPEDELERIIPNLESLEARFLPIAAAVPDEADMAVFLKAAPEKP